MTDDDPLLSVRGLEKHYPITGGLLRREVGRVRAVDGVSFDLYPGEALGLVGESGCGKSTTVLSALRLEEPTGGEIRFRGDDVLDYDDAALRRFRRRVQLVLQDPDSAFNPRLTVGEAVAEPLAVHGLDDRERRRQVVEDALERVGLSAADADSYPHEFSGGEKQRIALARALVVNPDVIVADEPVSALDGRTKGDVLGLLADIRRTYDVSILLISHDVDLVGRFCDRVAVMYLGRVVERGPADVVLDDPSHPYTRVLASSVPSLDPRASGERRGVDTPTDELPDPADPPAGCRFHPRCPAIIQPTDVDLPREQWRSLVSLRFRLEREWTDLDDVRAAVTRALGDEARAASVDGRSVRAAFGLPEELADEDAEAVLAEALASLADGDLATARDRLAAAFTSVCERESPASNPDCADHPVACHRYDPDQPGDPETGIPVDSPRE